MGLWNGCFYRIGSHRLQLTSLISLSRKYVPFTVQEEPGLNEFKQMKSKLYDSPLNSSRNCKENGFTVIPVYNKIICRIRAAAHTLRILLCISSQLCCLLEAFIRKPRLPVCCFLKRNNQCLKSAVRHPRNRPARCLLSATREQDSPPNSLALSEPFRRHWAQCPYQTWGSCQLVSRCRLLWFIQ